MSTRRPGRFGLACRRFACRRFAHPARVAAKLPRILVHNIVLLLVLLLVLVPMLRKVPPTGIRYEHE